MPKETWFSGWRVRPGSAIDFDKYAMKRWLLVIFCAIFGLTMLVCGLLVPAHLRAVDVNLLKLAAKKGPSVVLEGFNLLTQKQVGPAQLFLDVATKENLWDHEKLEAA